jgi:hypothetical protein
MPADVDFLRVRLFPDRPSRRRIELRRDGAAGQGMCGEPRLHREPEPAASGDRIEIGAGKKIRKPCLLRGIEKDPSVKPAHPPLILVLDERGVRPFDDRSCENEPPARSGKFRDVELRRQPGIL